MSTPTYEVEFDITHLIRQLLRNPTNAPSTMGTNGEATTDVSGGGPNVYVSMMQQNQNIIEELVYGYNTQMLRYNSNVERLIQLLQSSQTRIHQYMMSSSSPSRHFHTGEYTAPPDMTPLYSPLRRNAIREDGNLIRAMLNNPIYNTSSLLYTYLYPRSSQENRHTTLSPEQRNLAIQNVNYDSHSMRESVCPISLLPFTEGEQVCKIRHCGHIFKEESLNNWLSNYSTRCPVCRYDIRNYRESNTTNNRNNNTHESFDYESDHSDDE